MKTSKLWRYDADCPKLRRFHFISFLYRVSLLSQCQNRTLHKSRPAADVVAVQTARPTMQAEPSNKLPKAHRKHLGLTHGVRVKIVQPYVFFIFPWRMFTGRMIWPVNIADLTAPNPAAGLPARAATTKHLHPLPAKSSVRA